MLGMAGLADVHDVLIADVEPVDGEAELRMIAVAKAEIVHEPVAGPFRIMREDQKVFEKSQAHGLAPDVKMRAQPACSAEIGRVSPVSTTVRVAAGEA